MPTSSQPLNRNEIANKDVYANIIEGADKAIDVVGTLNEVMAETLKISDSNLKSLGPISEKSTAKNIETVNKTILENQKIRKGLIALEKAELDLKNKQRKADSAIKKEQEQLIKQTQKEKKQKTEKLKLQEKIVKETSEEGKGLAELQLQLNEQRKANRELAKEKAGLITEYDNESKRLNKLRVEYKDLAISEGEASDSAQELLKEIVILDKRLKDIDESAGQFSRNVGNYPTEIQATVVELRNWQKVLETLEVAQEKDTAAIKKARREVKKLTNTIEESTKEANKNEKTLRDQTKALLQIGIASLSAKGAYDGLLGSLNANEEGSESLRKVQAQLSAATQTLGNRLGAAASSLFDIATAAVTGKSSIASLHGSIQQIQNTFKGFTKEVATNAQAAKTAIEDQIAYEKQSRKLRLELEKVTGALETQRAIAGDDTRGFEELIEASERVTDLQIKQSLIRQKLAKEEISIIENQITARGEGANNLDLENKLTEKQIELSGIQNELDVARVENLSVLRRNERDFFERELDFAVDAFDAQKTVNEIRVQDERKTLAERSKIAQQTTNLADSAFKEQIKLLEDFTKQSLDIESLVEEQDERVIRERLRGAGLDDITLGRILEVIRERKFVLQDIADIERDIANERKRVAQSIEQSAQNIEQENRSFELETATPDKRREIQKQILIDEAAFQKELIEQTVVDEQEKAAKILEINNKLRNDLDRLARQSQKERIEDVKKFTQSILTQVNTEFSERAALRNRERENEVQSQQNQLNEALRLAKDGDENLLAFRRQQLAKAQLERRQELKKQQQFEEAIKLSDIFLESFSNRLNQNQSSAEAGTGALADTFLAKGLSKIFLSLAGFKEGTIDSGTVRNPLDADGARPVLLHDNERVVPKHLNKLYGGIPNEQAAEIVYNHRLSKDATARNRDQAPTRNPQLERLIKAIEEKPVPSLELNGLGELVRKEVKGQVTTVIKSKQLRRYFNGS